MEGFLGPIGLLSVAAISPGPNNVLVLAMATRRSLAGVLSVISAVLVGGICQLLITWAFVGLLTLKGPVLMKGITFVGAVYLGYLGWSLLRQPIHSENGLEDELPLAGSFWGLLVFQLVNPKSWVLTITVTTALSEVIQGMALLITVVMLFVLIASICLSCWAGLGAFLQQFLKNNRRYVWFQRLMGMFLLGSALLLLI